MGMIQIFYTISKKELDELKEVKDLAIRNDLLNSTRSEVDIDKSWEIFQYLLTDETGPSQHLLSNIFYPKNSTLLLTESEKTIYDRDDYYQSEEYEAIDLKFQISVSYLTPDETTEIYDSLLEIDIDEVLEECDFEEVTEFEIYPGVWEGSQEDKIYIRDNFKILMEVFEKATKEKLYIIVEMG